MRASVHELHVTANELNMDLHVLIIFYQSFYLLWGEKKFKVLVYTGNNNLEYLANLLQSTGTCMLFIFTQSEK